MPHNQPGIHDVMHKLDHMSELIERIHRREMRLSEAIAAQLEEIAASGSDAEQAGKLRALAANLSAIAPSEKE